MYRKYETPKRAGYSGQGNNSQALHAVPYPLAQQVLVSKLVVAITGVSTIPPPRAPNVGGFLCLQRTLPAFAARPFEHLQCLAHTCFGDAYLVVGGSRSIVPQGIQGAIYCGDLFAHFILGTAGDLDGLSLSPHDPNGPKATRYTRKRATLAVIQKMN